VLLCEGLGKYHHERIYLDDTVLWDSVTGFAAGFDAEVAFYAPGETVTLFPAGVQTAAEVGSQQLPGGSPGEWVGPFAANSAGTADRLRLRAAGRLLHDRSEQWKPPQSHHLARGRGPSDR